MKYQFHRENRVELFAEIVFDSFAQSAAAGLRGAQPSRQLVLQAEDVDIHLRVSGPDGARVVFGQILQRSTRTFLEAVSVGLVVEQKWTMNAVTNDLGEFRFENVPSGMIGVAIELPSDSSRIIGVFGIGEDRAA